MRQRPIISVTDVRASYVGPSLQLAPHRNAAATLVLALEGTFDLAVDGADAGCARAGDMKAALVPPGALHHLACRGLMAFLYLDGSSDDTASLQGGDLARLRDRIAAAGSACWRSWDADDWAEALDLPMRRADARIAATARELAADPGRFASASAAASHAGLSSSRFQALFRGTLGAPFRRWRLWRRLVVAVSCMAQGSTLTSAAHEAGFASSAHFSTAFRTMFGISPSLLLQIGADIRVAARLPSELGAEPRQRHAGIVT